MKNLIINDLKRTKSLCLLTLVILTLSFNNVCAQYGSWQYRSPVRIIENSGVSKTNYQVRMVVNTAAMVSAGQLDTTGKDLRFGDCTNPSYYNFWIESGMNTANTEIWVLLPTLAANDTATVFMYYGNNAATNESNFDSTFTIATRLVVSAGTVPLAGTNNYSWFEVQAGATVQNANEDFLVINARKIKITGTLDGNGKGEIAAPLGFEWTAAGSGKYGCGGGGGAHGGNGGMGSSDGGCPYGLAGIAQGSASINSTLYGYSGGDADSDEGGAGGGAVTLRAGEVEITGAVNMNGIAGTASNPLFGGSGGGAGGGILINANDVSISASGQLFAKGGKGGDAPGWYGGGGGGGGRIKIFYDNVYTNTGTTSVTGGNAGIGTPAPGAGQLGSIYSDAFYNAGEPTVIISPNSSFNLTSSDADNSICSGASVTFTASAGLTNYKFIKNSGTILQTGASNVYTTTTLADGDTVFVVTSFDGCPDTSNTIIMNVDNFPIATASNTGVYCAGDTIQLNSVGGSATDDWAGPNAYSQTDMQNPTIASSTTIMSGLYTVTVTTGAGCTATATTNVVVNANPIANATNTGPYCEGETIQLNSVGGAPTDDWAGPNSYSQPDMQNPSIPNSTVAMSGSYAVLVTNGAGCTATATTTLVVNTNPITPTISQSGDTLIANPNVGFTYQWDLNGNPIAGATSSTYLADSTGAYSVIITNGNGCSSTSVDYSYTSTVSIQENQLGASINIYPNPTAGYVNISFTEAATGHIEIIDLNGRMIRNILIPDLQTLVSFDASEFASGIYQIKISTIDYTIYKRLVIK